MKHTCKNGMIFINGIELKSIGVELTSDMSKEVKKILKLLDKENKIYKELEIMPYGEYDIEELDELPKSWKGAETKKVYTKRRQLKKIEDQLWDLRNTITEEEYDRYIERITLYDAREWFGDY